MKTPNCLICKTKIDKPYHQTKEKWLKRKYCSLECSAKSKENKKESICDNCGNKYLTKPSHHKRNENNFCSQKCHSEYRSKIPMIEQPAYKGVRKEGQSKEVYCKRYRDKHPNIIAHMKARRYARERGSIGSHSLIEWESLKAAYENKCAKCGEEKKLTKDHIMPLSKGGSDFIENIQPLCRNCNSKKYNKIEIPNY